MTICQRVRVLHATVVTRQTKTETNMLITIVFQNILILGANGYNSYRGKIGPGINTKDFIADILQLMIIKVMRQDKNSSRRKNKCQQVKRKLLKKGVVPSLWPGLSSYLSKTPSTTEGCYKEMKRSK